MYEVHDERSGQSFGKHRSATAAKASARSRAAYCEGDMQVVCAGIIIATYFRDVNGNVRCF